MVKRVFAGLLFFYAAWQIFTCVGTMQQYGTRQGLGQLFWAVLAIAAGIYLWKRRKRTSGAPRETGQNAP